MAFDHEGINIAYLQNVYVLIEILGTKAFFKDFILDDLRFI